MDKKYILDRLIKLCELIYKTTQPFAYMTEGGKYVFGSIKNNEIENRNIVTREIAIYIVINTTILKKGTDL